MDWKDCRDCINLKAGDVTASKNQEDIYEVVNIFSSVYFRCWPNVGRHLQLQPLQM